MPNPFAGNTSQTKNKLLIWLSFFSGATLLGLGLVVLMFIINSLQGIFPDQTTLGGVDISLLSQEAAQTKVEEKLANPGFSLILSHNGQDYATSSSSIDFNYLISESVTQAFTDSHDKLKLSRPLELFKALIEPKKYTIGRAYNQEALEKFVTETAEQIDIPGHAPFAKLGSDHNLKSLVVDRGKIGQEIDKDKLLEELKTELQNKNDQAEIKLAVDTNQTHQELTETEHESAVALATKYINTTLLFNVDQYKDVRLEIKPTQLVALLAFPTGLNQPQLNKLIVDLGAKVDRPSRDAVFSYEKLSNNQIKVKDFQPHHDGLGLNKTDLADKITKAITEIAGKNHEEIPELIEQELALEVVKPTLTLEKLNDLGIKELIGFGDSYYAHSIPNRIWNVALAAEKINYTLIPPDTEFSFNKNLGEVSRGTGYRSAYIISGGKTILGDGGGVCQVSTTLFRAALNAGLDITKRKAHAYRVSYYELNQKPGIDATVYSGDVDLRFINDTPGYILMRTETDSENLYMKIELYGTSDGRTAEITNHKTWDARNAPAPAYYPTTEIPAGTTKQIDWSVSGIKASFDYIVKDKNGQIINQENYYSNYVPWSAKYLKGI